MSVFISSAFDLEIAKYIHNGWTLVNRTEEFAQLTKDRSRSGCLILILLLLGILPAILYMLIPIGKDNITLWAKDSAAREAAMVAAHQTELERLAKVAERKRWIKEHPAEHKAQVVSQVKEAIRKAKVILLAVAFVAIEIGLIFLLAQLTGG